MGKDTKIVHVAILDGEPEMIRALADHLTKLKKDTELDVEFLVTNDKIQLRDVKYLIDELYKLYKAEKSIVEQISKGKK
jgi:wyosine [tRNA(Phe)-imidazoG37] synthetase (radical SAM superfamily)